jgi:hypothetical protein
MTERITFSVTLRRDDALHLQEAANEGGLLLSEYAARCLASIAEDDRNFGYGTLLPAQGETQVVGGIDRSPNPWWRNHADTGVPGHPPLVDDECVCACCEGEGRIARTKGIHLDAVPCPYCRGDWPWN